LRPASSSNGSKMPKLRGAARNAYQVRVAFSWAGALLPAGAGVQTVNVRAPNRVYARVMHTELSQRRRSALGVLCVLGGCEPTAPPPSGAPWATLAIPAADDGSPRRRLEASAAALGTRLAIVGGITNDVPPFAITNEVLAYDTLADTWEQLPDAPVAWTHANLAGNGGALFLLGGLEASFVPRGDCFVLEVGAADWTALPSMPDGQARGAAAVVVGQGHVFLLGGAGAPEDTAGTGLFANTLDFDLTKRTWSVAPFPDIPLARSHAAAMRTQAGTFVIAGGQGVTGVLGDVQQLVFGASAWRPGAQMSVPRAGCAYGVAFGQLLCAGGDDGTTPLALVESYNPTIVGGEVGRWTVRSDLPEQRTGSRGTTVAQRLYVPGGSASLAFAPTDMVFVYSPANETP